MDNNELFSDEEMSKLLKAEGKLFDLQKDQFDTIRTLITASAALASVDLLAMQALNNLGLENWFMGSVVFLYLSSIIFVFYLTLSSNIQTKMIIERDGMTKGIMDMTNDKELNVIEGMKAFSDSVSKYVTRATKDTKIMQKSSTLLAIGNTLFIIGLIIPIIGFVKFLVF